MKRSAKIAVSLPANVYTVLERIRHRRGQSRSALVAEAIEQWAQREEIGDADQKYAEAYLKQPEQIDEVGATAAAATAGWELWE